MDFSPDLRDDVISGAITVSFRLWQRPRVRVGGRYAVGPAQIEVDSIELLPFAAISAADLRCSGEPDREALRRRAAHAGPVDDDTLLYRVEFHLVAEPPRRDRYES
jgi:ASCH domain